MIYKNPLKVDGSGGKWTEGSVLYDEGEGGFSIAYGAWNAEPSYGLRWNGYQNISIGHPIARNKIEAWFIVPEAEVGDEIIKILAVQQLGGNKFVNEENLRSLIKKIPGVQPGGFSEDYSSVGSFDESAEIITGVPIERLENQLIIAFGDRNDAANSIGLGLRWNGVATDNESGFPAHGQWFMVPHQIGKSMISIICRFLASGNGHIDKEKIEGAINYFYHEDSDNGSAKLWFDKRTW